MIVSNQDELANLIDPYFTHGLLEINSFIFKQFYSVESDQRKKLLNELYTYKDTANYSFESKKNSVSEIIGIFDKTSSENQKTHFMVFDKNNDFLGRCNLRVDEAEIHFGIALKLRIQGKGYGKAILKTLFMLCFNLLKLEQNIYGSTMSYNIKSQMTMAKTGMTPDGNRDKTFGLALDTKWLKYKITPTQFSANNMSVIAHAGSRKLRDVILEDYFQSCKNKANEVKVSEAQNTAMCARARFFARQESRNIVFKQYKRKLARELERKKMELEDRNILRL
ncbi:MAG: GNAT family N-acetyltransferase [Gammaproteobacteria bacterium]|nr:GNAT family N-acetyltransferase [Gammaproteobacteria bacterium]